MARSDALESGELTDTAFYILLSLVEAKHGYLIMKTIDTLTNHQFKVGPASMYTTLKKLETAELITQFHDGDVKKKTYIATGKGINLLEKEVERRRRMVSHAEQILNKKGRKSQ